MATVTLVLHGDDTESVIDLDRLTPLARSLAEALAERPLRTRGTVTLESTRTLGDLYADDEAMGWHVDPAEIARSWTAEQLAERHRTHYDSWARYPADSTVDPHEYLEREARKLPIGYAPIGGVADDLLALPQVLALLKRAGHPMAPTTWRSYQSRGQAPAPGRYVYDRPLWSRGDIDAWIAARPGAGARTDLRQGER